MTYRVFALLALLLAILAGVARAGAPSSFADPPSGAFDPNRHMRVAEVKPGMLGYGLSVFHGTKIERFDVEVVSVLRNFNPKYDVVLIKCKGDYLQHTGSIAGMSGSPIYLKDEEGHYRLIGAFAYGWPMTKDPVAGVQPIEYMLRLPAAKSATITAELNSTTRPSQGSGSPLHSDGHRGLSWSLSAAGLVPFWKGIPGQSRVDAASGLSAAPRLGGSDEAPRLQPLATPLMAGGISPGLLRQVAPLFSGYGLTVLQAGDGGGSASGEPAAKLEPGSVLAVPLLTGDADFTAIGTCTEVIGDRVFGFGHPFANEGMVALPMGSGEIHAVIANLQTSFKLGSVTQERGQLNADESVGVAGLIGQTAPTISVEFHVTYANGMPPRTYRFQSVLHPKLTPMIAGVALAAAVTGTSDLPQYNTLDYDLKLEFANGKTLSIANTAVNTNPQELLSEIGLPLMAASENPFERVLAKKISGEIRISAEARQAQILEVNVPRSRYRPGETVKAFVTYKPFREEDGILPVELELPRDLPQGSYQLIISDAQRFFQDEQQSKPFRFTADSIQDVFGVLKDVASIRENAVYLRLLRQADGVAVGRVAMPQFPSSRRQILLGAGRSNITAFVSSTVKTIPTERVMAGSAEFTITVDPRAKVEVAGPKPAKPDATPPAPAANNIREPHRSTGTEAPPAKESQPKEDSDDKVTR